MGKRKRTDPRQRPTAGKTKQSPGRPSAQSPARWSAQVTRTSNALDLEPKVFAKGTPGAIARSLKRSAEASDRRKADPYRSAMSMLTFYINRAGRNLSQARLSVLQRAKGELRKAFGRDARSR